MSNIKKWNWWLNSGGGVQAFDAPYPLRVASLNTTTVTGWLVKNAADTYNWYLYDSAGTTLLQSDLASSSSSKTFTGLTIGTEYTVKVSANKAGFGTSAELSKQITTFSFLPSAMYNIEGLDRNTDNYYGTVDNSNVISVIKSIVNSGGPNLTTSTATLGITDALRYSPYIYANSDSNYLVSASAFALTGNFTIAFTMKAVSSATYQFFQYSGDANNWIRWNNVGINLFRLNVNGSGVNLSFAALTAGLYYDFVIRRSGTDFTVSTDGGATFGSPVSGTSNTLTLDKFFGSAADQPKKLLISTSALNASQLSEFFNYKSQAAFTQPTQETSIAVTGQTFSAKSTNYLVDTTYDVNVLASYIRDRIIVREKYAFILGNLKSDTTYYGEDFVRVWNMDADTVTPNKLLGIPRAISDTHNSGSLFDHANTIKHIEMDSHYDSGTPQPTRSIIKEFGKSYNLAEYTQQVQANGVCSVIDTTTQYVQLQKMSASVVAKTLCEWDTINGMQRYFSIEFSTDNLNTWTKYRVLDVGATYWVYYSTVYAEDGKIRVFLNIENKTGGGRDSKYDYLCYIESSDGYTWTNLGGGYSKDVRGGNELSLSNLTTNCMIQDASALTGNAKIEWGFYDYSDGEILGIIGDGDDSSLLMLYSSGSSWNTETIDAGGKTLVYDLRTGNANNSPILIRRATDTYDAYVHEDNSGNWKIIRYRTTNKGVDWTYQDDISTDNTSQHLRMHINRNALYSDNIALGAARKVSATNSDMFLKKIT